VEVGEKGRVTTLRNNAGAGEKREQAEREKEGNLHLSHQGALCNHFKAKGKGNYNQHSKTTSLGENFDRE